MMALDEDLLGAYFFHGTLLVLKMFAVGTITNLVRLVKDVFANPEDAGCSPRGVVSHADPDVERCLRSHLNDLENILPFLFLAGVFISTQPDHGRALWCFRAFTLSRYSHTFVYLKQIPQPARVLIFSIGMLVNVYMSVEILCYYF
eukprot:maker-scaffold613_size124221-snap-gene-0.29 protein:Tk11736 transcript:maker-scaffold613_size124221-snap-gene-0.29-mRNA-1 annotation:"hypothetical protein CAPTEDRAFT_214121"